MRYFAYLLFAILGLYFIYNGATTNSNIDIVVGILYLVIVITSIVGRYCKGYDI